MSDLWYVKLADGDVHRVNLDQLDDAFQAGHIDACTMVLAADSTEWKPLGQLLGLDTEPSLHAEAEAEHAADEPTTEHDEGDAATLQVIAQAPILAATAPAALAQSGATQAFPTAPALTPQNAFPQRGPVLLSVGGAPTSSRGQGSLLPAANSVLPLSVDLGESDPELPRPRKSRKTVFAALVGLALVGGVATVGVTRPPWARPVLSKMGLQGSTAAVAVAPPGTIDAPPPPVAEPPAPPPRIEPPPIAAPPPPPEVASDVKVAVENAKKAARAARVHGGGGSSVGAAHAGSGKGKPSTFTTTGNKYDPLNSSI